MNVNKQLILPKRFLKSVVQEKEKVIVGRRPAITKGVPEAGDSAAKGVTDLIFLKLDKLPFKFHVFEKHLSILVAVELHLTDTVYIPS